MAQDGHWVRGYAPAGHAPVLEASSQRFGLTMISAISSKGLVRFEFLEGAATTETTLGFMQRLVQDNVLQEVSFLARREIEDALNRSDRQQASSIRTMWAALALRKVNGALLSSSYLGPHQVQQARL